MGEKALIKKINFIGDKKYKDRKLHSVITSEEAKFWKFISRGKYLDEERINLDKRLLKNFYLNKGYYNVVIENAFSQLVDEEYFEKGQKEISNFLEYNSHNTKILSVDEIVKLLSEDNLLICDK